MIREKIGVFLFRFVNYLALIQPRTIMKVVLSILALLLISLFPKGILTLLSIILGSFISAVLIVWIATCVYKNKWISLKELYCEDLN